MKALPFLAAVLCLGISTIVHAEPDVDGAEARFVPYSGPYFRKPYLASYGCAFRIKELSPVKDSSLSFTLEIITNTWSEAYRDRGCRDNGTKIAIDCQYVPGGESRLKVPGEVLICGERGYPKGSIVWTSSTRFLLGDEDYRQLFFYNDRIKGTD